MIPYGLTWEQLSSRYWGMLYKSSADLISEIRILLTMDVPPSVSSAEVQIFLDEGGMNLPSAWIYFEGKNKKIDNSDESIFPGRSMEIKLHTENMEFLDERYFEDEELDVSNLIGDIIKLWFAECWWKAGGWSYTAPTKVWVHDDYGNGEPIDLSEPH